MRTVTEKLQAIEAQYLGGQSVQEFVANGGDIGEYARQVFAREVFGPDEDPRTPELDINTEDDLVAALEALR